MHRIVALAVNRRFLMVGLFVVVYVAVRMVYQGADLFLGGWLPPAPLIDAPMPLPNLA